MRTGTQLDRERETKLRQFNVLATMVVAVVTLFVFWTGLYVLQHDVFKDYYNPERHVIVQQDPETLEVYAWRDSSGHIYTRDCAAVRYFPYGITALFLLLMGLAPGMYHLLTRAYAAWITGEILSKRFETSGTKAAFTKVNSGS